MANKKIENKALGAVFDGIVAVYGKKIVGEDYNGTKIDTLSVQVRWGSSYGMIKTINPKEIIKLDKFNIDDVIHIRCNVTNNFSKFYGNNLLVFNDFQNIDRIGILSEKYRKTEKPLTKYRK